MIRVRDAVVSVPSRARNILDIEDLTIDRGTWTALVGANGSGKSTLLAVLAGLTPLRSGVTEFAGDTRPRTALLLQDPDNQLVATTVALELELSAARNSAATSRIADVVACFSLGDLLERNPHRLSGGEKQRLTLASVSLQEPDLVLLDEPTSFLDESASKLCATFVEELRSNGTTVVWATPSNTTVLAADRVVCLDNGSVRYAGAANAWPHEPGADAFDRWDPPRSVRSSPLGEVVSRLDAVSFAYDAQEIVNDMRLEVCAGEVVGIAGPNGCGKTTLLLIAAGVIRPGRGRVQKPDGVFYQPQSPERLFFAESVAEEIAFGLERLGISRGAVHARAQAAIAAVGLDPREFAARSPFRLSFGEMRRVAFAIGEALEPALMLLDEPNAGLDRDGHEVLGGVLARIRARRGAALVASHDRGFLDAACDRVVEMSGNAD